MLIATHLWVGAYIKTVQKGGGFAYVTHHGDDRAGSVLLKIIDPMVGEFLLLRGAMGPDGELVWMRPKDSPLESELDRYIQKQRRFDPDLWVIEVESKGLNPFLTEKIEEK